MWSERYNYYNIQSDISCAEEKPIHEIAEALQRSGFFKEIAPQSFSNADHFPWATILITKATETNFGTSKQLVPVANLISIVCAKGKDVDQQIYIEAFKQVAKTLGWKLFLEEDDEGNTAIQIGQ